MRSSVTIKSFVLLFVMLFTAQLYSQDVSISRTKTGIESGIAITGNGLSGHYAHGLYRKGSKNLIGAYVLTPYSSKSIDGGQLYYSRVLLDNDASYNSFVGLHIFTSVSYLKRTSLSRSSMQAMEVLAPEYKHTGSISYETIEAYLGMGLSANLNSRLSIYADLGVGKYQTLSETTTEAIPVKFKNYRSDKDLALNTKAGLRFKISR
jgi:hypothetical protein